MAVIQTEVYRAVERRLRNQDELTERSIELLAQARTRAIGVASMRLDSEGGHSGRHDRLEMGAITLAEAEERVEECRRWEAIIRKVDSVFEGKQEARVAELLFRQHLRQRDVGQTLYIDRQTVMRSKDKYVAHVALLAVEAGLVKVRENDEY